MHNHIEENYWWMNMNADASQTKSQANYCESEMCNKFYKSKTFLLFIIILLENNMINQLDNIGHQWASQR